MPAKSLLEIQFPIAQLSLESYLERTTPTGKILHSLGKWWGTKPIVLTRAVILASLFEASDNPERWPDDLAVFFKLMCFDPAGMWRRRNEGLAEISAKPPHPRFVELCHPLARLSRANACIRRKKMLVATVPLRNLVLRLWKVLVVLSKA